MRITQIANVEKGTNDGQAIVTLTTGKTLNISSAPSIEVAGTTIYITHPVTGQSLTLFFDEVTLNKQSQASAQALVNFWFDNNFFFRRTGGAVPTPVQSDVDVETSAISVAGQYMPTKTFVKLLDVQLSNVPIDLNRVTFDGTTITFLDGAVINERVKVIGATVATPASCLTLSAGPLSPIASGAVITITSGNLSDYNNVFNEFSAASVVQINLPPLADVTDGDEMQFIIPDTSPAQTFIGISPDSAEEIDFEGSPVASPNILRVGRTDTPSLGRDSVQITKESTQWVVCDTEGIVAIIGA